jgi:hypothetical protein
MADMPESLKAEYERIGREREVASRKADRDALFELVRVCAEMIGWTIAGLVFVFFAFWVGDVQSGWILFYMGWIVNVGGVAWSIWAAYQRGERRGDW